MSSYFHNLKKKKAERKTPISTLMHIYGIYQDGNNNPICETAKETQMYRTDFWTLWEKVRVGWSERVALKHVHYQVQVWCMRQGVQGGYTGMTLRDGGHMCTHGWLMSMYGKNHYSIEKKIEKKKEKSNIQPNIPNFTYNNFAVMKIYIWIYIQCKFKPK